MKKYVFCLSLCFLLLLSACGSKTLTEQITNELGIDVRTGTVLENRDNHGWFGDGETFVSLSFSPAQDRQLLENMKGMHAWKEFPLTKNLQAALYGEAFENYDQEPLFDNENGKPLVPPVEEGYYCFLDRHNESKDPTDDTNLYSRVSYNFTLAVYDTENRILYYLRFDS